MPGGINGRTAVNPRQQIADNLARVRGHIAEVADRCGRASEEIFLLPVTKYVGPELASVLADCGCPALAESRPQQLWEKADAIQGVRWHLVGHLQRNKVRRTLPLVTLTHSVDSVRLLQAIDAEAVQLGKPARVLLEVNTSGESQKHGFLPDELSEALDASQRLEHVAVEGLMTLARRGGGDAARKDFAALRELRGRLQSRHPDVRLNELSMGMSGDYPEAIAEGATIVRIGSTLFVGIEL